VLNVGTMVATAGRDSGGKRLTGPDWGWCAPRRGSPRRLALAGSRVDAARAASAASAQRPALMCA
jgi:hypothetical protein